MLLLVYHLWVLWWFELQHPSSVGLFWAKTSLDWIAQRNSSLLASFMSWTVDNFCVKGIAEIIIADNFRINRLSLNAFFCFSVMALQTICFNVGQEITMKLMKKGRGQTLVSPSLIWNSEHQRPFSATGKNLVPLSSLKNDCLKLL